MKNILIVLLTASLLFCFYSLAKAEAPSVVAEYVSSVNDTVLPNEFLVGNKIVIPDEDIVRLYFKDVPIMIHIAEAESGFDCSIKNPGSSAKGCFQILDSTWIDYKCIGGVLNTIDNIKCARIIYNRSGTVPWNESKGTWGKYL